MRRNMKDWLLGWLLGIFLAIAMLPAQAGLVSLPEGGKTANQVAAEQCGGSNFTIITPRNISPDTVLGRFSEVRFRCGGEGTLGPNAVFSQVSARKNVQPESRVTDPAPRSTWLDPDAKLTSYSGAKSQTPRDTDSGPQSVGGAWNHRSHAGVYQWTPGSNPFKGSIALALAEMYGVEGAGLALVVSNEEPIEASMDCQGIINANGVQLIATQMAFGKNSILSAGSIVPKACTKNPDYHEPFKIYKSGEMYVGIPPACDNPTRLTVVSETLKLEAETPKTMMAKSPEFDDMPPLEGPAREEWCVKRFDAYVGGGFDFAGARGVHGWIGGDGYCRIFVDDRGGKHFLGLGFDLYGGKGKVGGWEYKYGFAKDFPGGFTFRPVAYYWESADGKKNLRIRPLFKFQQDGGNDGKGYENSRNFVMGGVEVKFEEDNYSPGDWGTGYRLSGSVLWVMNRDGSHSYKNVPIQDVSGVLKSIHGALNLGGRIYIYDLEGDNGRIFGQVGFTKDIGGPGKKLGLSVGYTSKNDTFEIWMGPTWDLNNWGRAAFLGAQYNFGNHLLNTWADGREACAREIIGEQENGCSQGIAPQSPRPISAQSNEANPHKMKIRTGQFDPKTMTIRLD